MGKTLKRQRQRALREQQQQQDAGPSKLPRLAGMPVLKPSSSCSKYTYVVSATLQQGNWLAALQTLEAMVAHGKVPKLGAIQRWVRDADQAGNEAVTARLIDAICRSTLPSSNKSKAAAPPAAEDILQGSVKRHPPWKPTSAVAPPGQPEQDSTLQQTQQQQSVTQVPASEAATISTAGALSSQPGQAKNAPDYSKLYYQVPFAPGNGGPDAIYAYPPGTVHYDRQHPPVTAVPVPFVPGAQCLLGVLSKQECEQMMAAAEAIGYNANVDYTFGGAAGGDGGAEQQLQQQQDVAQPGSDSEQHQQVQEPQQQQQQQAANGTTKKLYSILNPGGLNSASTANDSVSAAKSAARGVAAELVGLPQGGPAAGCVWLVDDSVLQPLYERVAHLLPQELAGGKLAGLNARWRLYRYTPGNVYRPHIDGAWPGSGLDANGQYLFDAFGDRWSRLTFLVYLNDNFEGGHTTYYTPSEEQVGCLDARGVQPVQGIVMVFPHGGTVGSLVHEGSAVLKGAKYVIRTDVLYMKADNTGRRGQQQQQRAG